MCYGRYVVMDMDMSIVSSLNVPVISVVMYIYLKHKRDVYMTQCIYVPGARSNDKGF